MLQHRLSQHNRMHAVVHACDCLLEWPCVPAGYDAIFRSTASANMTASMLWCTHLTACWSGKTCFRWAICTNCYVPDTEQHQHRFNLPSCSSCCGIVSVAKAMPSAPSPHLWLVITRMHSRICALLVYAQHAVSSCTCCRSQE